MEQRKRQIPGAVSREEFQTDTCTPSEGNVCEKVTSGEFSGSVHWKAKYDDTAGQWKDLRKGTIKANTPIDISKMRFLDFSFSIMITRIRRR